MTYEYDWLKNPKEYIDTGTHIIYAGKLCPKCQSLNQRVRWHKDKFRTYSNKKTCEKYDEAQTEGEHLHYYCENCLFDWTGPVKDASNGAS